MARSPLRGSLVIRGKRRAIKIVSLKGQEIPRKRPLKQSRARHSFPNIDRGERRVRIQSNAGLRSMAVQTKSDRAAVTAGRTFDPAVIGACHLLSGAFAMRS